MGSRVCVKNLPKIISQEKLTEVFAAVGDVTDVKILFAKNGNSRHMGFVGFRDTDSAQRAIHMLNNTFITTHKIAVEEAKAIGAPDIPRPWSRYSEGSSKFNKVHKVAPKKEEKPKEEGKPTEEKRDGKKLDLKDPKLMEFLGLYNKGGMWDETKTEAEDENPSKKRKLNEKEIKKENEKETKTKKGKTNNQEPAKKGKTSNQEPDKKGKANNQEPSKKGKTSNQEADKKGKNAVAKRKIKSNALEDLGSEVYILEKEESDDEYDELPSAMQPIDEDGEIVKDDNFVDDFVEDDMAYLKSKMVDGKIKKDEEEEEEEEEGSEDEEKKQEEEEEKKRAAEEKKKEEEERKRKEVEDSGRLYVRNLAYTITEEELRELFAPFGPISDIHIVLDKASLRSKGIAFILYMVPANANTAREALDKKSFQGRLLHILPAKEKMIFEKPEKDKGTSSYKKEKEAKLKATRNNASNWNSLFMRSDAVTDAFAAKYNLSKQEILNPNNPDVAVNLALMEAQIIEETKQYFAENNVNIKVLSSSNDKALKRSTTVIIVKNIPYETNSNELFQMFVKHGSLSRLVMPPARTIAILEYLSPTEAKVGFTALAYRKYKGVPLFLEWAPEDIFTKKAIGTIVTTSAQGDTGVGQPSASIYVKNVSFSTVDQSLIELFKKFVGYRHMNIPKKNNPKTGLLQNNGVAFANFNNVHNATKCLEELQLHELDGHKLQLQYAKKQSTEAKPQEIKLDEPEKEGPNKIIVRNLPFEATFQDFKNLFNAANGFKSARLPTKPDKSHRGFGFVEFLTHNEAERALRTMSNIHLYGRHLALEWAERDKSVDDLQRQAKRDVSRM